VNIAERIGKGEWPQIPVWEEIATYIGTDPERFHQLMSIFFSDDDALVLRTGQILCRIHDKHPELVEPYLEQLIERLSTNPTDGFKRNALRCFQKGKLPEDEEMEGQLFDYCIHTLSSAEEPTAVKVFGMTAARRICERYPELAIELIHPIEILVEENFSAGVVNRGQKELKRLRKIIEQLDQ